MGIFVLKPFDYKGRHHDGVGVHSGKKGTFDLLIAHRTGTEAATMLCIRTTDAAMSMIHLTDLHDPLAHLIVRDN